jgi:hypothetical protein
MTESAAARHALLRFMEWWSEEHWCAGWLIDLEHQMALQATSADRGAFEWLVQRAGGWWTYDSEAGNRFVIGTFAELTAAASRSRTRSSSAGSSTR